MNIAALDYTFKQESLDIYISGCQGPHCKGCHNPQLWDFNKGQYWTNWCKKITDYVIDFNQYINNIMIFGGEPLDQDINELVKLLGWLELFNKRIWLFTGRELLDNVPVEVLSYLDYIKIGSYREDRVPGINFFGIELASSNQIIYKVR